MKTFDLIVIGGGPAGYVAAIRAAQLGLKTACIDERGVFGGTCLNVGCIPSKALLESSEHYWSVKKKFNEHGIQVQDVQLNLQQMMHRKSKIVQKLVSGIEGLFKKNQIVGYKAKAICKDLKSQKKIIQIQNEAADLIEAPRVLLATGSAPIELPFLKFDGVNILSSTEALSLTSVPSSLAVIGAGAIGLEMGSVWSRLGSLVTVIEYQDRICSSLEKNIALELYKQLQKQGLQFKLSTQVVSAQHSNHKISLSLKDRITDQLSVLEVEKVLVATGRKPYFDGLNLEGCGLLADPSGRLKVDSNYQTDFSGVYAIGDIIAGPMLAHKASEEGVVAVERMLGQKSHVNYDAVPNIIYTWPEVASVGKTEEQLQSLSIPYKTGTFPFVANGRAHTIGEIDGFIKVIAHASTDQLLGVHIVGPRASDLITEAVCIMEFNGSAEDMARICHAHPTLAESMKEAALGVDKRQVHI